MANKLFMIETTKKESNLLQFDIVKFSPSTHFPFHLDGILPIPSSLKLSDSGQIPLIEQKKIMAKRIIKSQN